MVEASHVACFTLTGFAADRGSPIVRMHFLSEYGELQVVPYKPLTPPREGRSGNGKHYLLLLCGMYLVKVNL